MEWIKIKAEHNSDELSDAQFGSLVRYQLLIARIGRTPTDKEIRRQTSIKTLRSAEEVLRNIGATLEHIESKVREDREQVNRKRQTSKKTSSKYRAKKKSDTSPECHADITDKIREDKIREDKYICANFEKLWKEYPSDSRRKKDECMDIYNRYCTSIEKEEEFGKALANYKQSKKFKEGYIQNSITWFRDWKTWLDYTREYSAEEKRMLARGLCLD